MFGEVSSTHSDPAVIEKPGLDCEVLPGPGEVTLVKHRLTLAALVVVLTAGACGDDTTRDAPADTSEPPATVIQPIEEPGATGTMGGGNAVQIARDVIAAWNMSDYDALVGYFAEDGRWDGHWIGDDAVQKNVRFYMVLGDNVEVDECEAGPTEGRVACRAVGHNDLSGPVGVVWEADWNFQITGGEVTSCGFAIRDPSLFVFLASMVDWVEQEYPDVFEATFAASGGCSLVDEYNCYQASWYASPEAAAVLLDLGPEFIAQSDEYSVDG